MSYTPAMPAKCYKVRIWTCWSIMVSPCVGLGRWADLIRKFDCKWTYEGCHDWKRCMYQMNIMKKHCMKHYGDTTHFSGSSALQEPDIRFSHQPDFSLTICNLCSDQGTWYQVPATWFIVCSLAEIYQVVYQVAQPDIWFLCWAWFCDSGLTSLKNLMVVHVGNLGKGSPQDLMRTKTSWSSVWTAQLKERVPGACLPRKLMATINFLGKQAPGTCGCATIRISQTRTAITFSVVHQTSFQE